MKDRKLKLHVLEEISNLEVVEIISGSGHSFFFNRILERASKGLSKFVGFSSRGRFFNVLCPNIPSIYLYLLSLYIHVYIYMHLSIYPSINPSIHPSIFLYKNPTAMVTWSPVGKSHRGSGKIIRSRSTGGKSRITSPKRWQFLITMIGSKVEKP